MPREFSDVLHYFLDGAVRAQAGRRVVARSPIGPDEVLRSAWLWNLALELRAHGCATGLVAPAGGAIASFAPADATLAARETSLDAALERAAEALPDAPAGRWLFALDPRRASDVRGDAAELQLLLVAPDEEEIARACERVAEYAASRPAWRVGVTIHGARDVAHAEATFLSLAERCASDITSYGVLLDDLAVYRALGVRRPLREHSPSGDAARSVADVARLLLEDHA